MQVHVIYYDTVSSPGVEAGHSSTSLSLAKREEGKAGASGPARARAARHPSALSSAIYLRLR